MGIFHSIKKSRRESSDIDEKIEYLNKELEKTGLREAMTTSNMYVNGARVPNQDYNDFNGLSQGGYALGLSGADGNSLGNAIIGINPSTGQTDVALSPPHPVTGVRRVASTVIDGVGSNRALRPGKGSRVRGTNDDGTPRVIKDGSAVWFWDPNYNFGGQQGRYLNFEWLDGQLGFWDTNFLGFFFHNTNLDEYEIGGVNIGTQIKNKIAGINFGDDGSVGTPQTLVLQKNDLGDPGFLPINIDGLSTQGFNYLRGKAGVNVSSSYYSPEDKKNVINYYKKKQADPNYQPKPYERESLIRQMRAQGGDGTKIASHDRPLFKSVPATGPRGDQPAHDLYKQAVQGGGATPSTGKYPLGIPLRLTHYEPEGKILAEGVKLGHFEPEQLNVNIEDLRKGIMPEFPKDPPPEMVDGYNPKSRLAPKKLERSSFIKITKKDLAKNHRLKDSEIKDFMDQINAINEFIKEHPEELIYAQTRYPKSDPRLAQLNWEMDQKLNASKEYMDKHYPENQKLFTKIQKSIKKNIELTDPKSFKGVKVPKFKGVDLTDFKRRKEVVARHYKKAVKTKKLFSRKKT